MTTISAQTILRSRHAQRPDKVLSTLLLRYPRPIHAEFMTHRQLSKNSASSRAIPTAKLIGDVQDDPFIPLHWGKNERGMQANEQLTGIALKNAKYHWEGALEDALGRARDLAAVGAHKQLVNRILEPYSHITVLASGTEWSNFLALRDHPDAEPHIQMLAREVRRELDREDNIQILNPGEWHMPFVTSEDWFNVEEQLANNGILCKVPGVQPEPEEFLIKKSVACCASTSYKTVDGFDMTLDKAIELHDKLVGSTPLHASPAEHVAQADDLIDTGFMGVEAFAHQREHGNFVGFRQYRKQLPNECL